MVSKKIFFGYILFLVCSFSTNIWAGECPGQDFLGKILGAQDCATGEFGSWLDGLRRDCKEASRETKERSKQVIDTIRRQIFLQAQASKDIEKTLACYTDMSADIAALQEAAQSIFNKHRKESSKRQKAENLASLACGPKDTKILPAGGLGGPSGEGLGGGGSGTKPSTKKPRTGTQKNKTACKKVRSAQV